MTTDNLSAGTVNPFITFLARLYYVPKRWFLRRRVNRVVVERVAGRDFVVLPDVFNPVLFRTGKYLAEYLRELPQAGFAPDGTRLRALDVGTGCGIHAIFAENLGYRVDAIDINESAISCARMNLVLNDCEAGVDIHMGDLFDPVIGRRFDLVICSLPKFRGKPTTAFEIGWRSTDVIERFAATLPEVLKRDGFALVLLTTHGDDEGMLTALLDAGLAVSVADRRHYGVEIMTIYRVSHQPPIDHV